MCFFEAVYLFVDPLTREADHKTFMYVVAELQLNVIFSVWLYGVLLPPYHVQH